MQFNILTLFPEAVTPYLETSILKVAHEKNLISSQVVNIRDFADDKHQTVDDTPYGGGPGMVLKIEPIHKALKSTKSSRVIVMSARGNKFDQAKAEEYAKLDSLTLICGRYEGIDQRVVENLADEEISVGPYVLAGGELPALIVIEATTRLIPGVLGNEASLADSKSLPGGVEGGFPQFTKPENYNGWRVPEVLLSGDHEKIRQWRESHSK